MIPYDAGFDPPAPVVEIQVAHPLSGQQRTLRAQLDTGADISGVPAGLVQELSLVPARTILVEGYSGIPDKWPTYVVVLEVAGQRFRWLEVVPLPGPDGLLGRDVLNHLYARLDGPDLAFELAGTRLP